MISVRGKRGVGYCKSTSNAVRPFERLRDRKRPPRTDRTAGGGKPAAEWRTPAPTDRLFPISHRDQFKRIPAEEKLQTDREGNRRTAYSLRHTYICLRLMEGADIYAIAKNCRTSIEMIEKFYAAHIKSTLDAAAINVLRPRRSRTGKKNRTDSD